MRPLTINVDLDGVVYDFTEAFARLNPDIELDRSEWNLGLPGELFASRFEEAILNGVFLVGNPIEGALEGLAALANAGHQVRLVTAKQMATSYATYVAQVNTLQWLDINTNLLPRVEVVFTNHAKVGYPADVVIDDHPGMAWTQRYGRNLLFDQPWNQVFDLKKTLKMGHKMTRAMGWDHIAVLLEEQAA